MAKLSLVGTDDIGFAPTREQEKAREIVRGLVDEGFLAPTDWLNELRVRGERRGSRPEITSQEWREYLALDGFEEWFYEGLYPKPSKHSLRSLNEAWFSGLRTALSKGEPRTLKWYHDTVINGDGASDDGEELMEAIRMNQKAPAWRKRD